MEVPEFDLFARIENLERLVGAAHPSTRDESDFAMHVLELAFIARAIRYPSVARRATDTALQKLRDLDFNDPWLDLLAADLIEICEALEKKLSSPVI